jgi:hypothetical protein
MIRKTTPMSLCPLYMLACWMAFSGVAGSQNQLPKLSGTILINIFAGSKYHDLSLSLSNGILQEIAKGKVINEKRNGRDVTVLQGSNYFLNSESLLIS